MHADINEKQKEILEILVEECAEVIQAKSKIIRFGLETEFGNASNLMILAKELADLQVMIDLTISTFNINQVQFGTFELAKINNLKKYSGIYKDEEN